MPATEEPTPFGQRSSPGPVPLRCPHFVTKWPPVSNFCTLSRQLSETYALPPRSVATNSLHSNLRSVGPPSPDWPNLLTNAPAAENTWTSRRQESVTRTLPPLPIATPRGQTRSPSWRL